MAVLLYFIGSYIIGFLYGANNLLAIVDKKFIVWLIVSAVFGYFYGRSPLKSWIVSIGINWVPLVLGFYLAGAHFSTHISLWLIVVLVIVYLSFVILLTRADTREKVRYARNIFHKINTFSYILIILYLLIQKLPQ